MRNDANFVAMFIESIRLTNFKNHAQWSATFNDKYVSFFGKNGAGKTSILDAIYLLCTGKSYFTSIDNQLIKLGEDFLNAFLVIKDNSGATFEVFCGLMIGKRKNLKVNGNVYKKLSDHYGRFPIIMIAPKDWELISGGSEDRRNWMDSIICLVDKDYLTQLNIYLSIIQQRNAELKRLNTEGIHFKSDLIAVYNVQLDEVGTQLFSKRNQFLNDFIPLFQSVYLSISQTEEQVAITYQSPLLIDTFLNILENQIKKDIILERTTQGIHKDDILITIYGQEAKKIASQGQIKSLIFAIKLSAATYILNRTNKRSILCLDDVAERLDEFRLKNLFLCIESLPFEQVFMTDTAHYRIENLIPDHLQQIEIK
jgi:DNA replication and repair protein RecF